MDVSLIKPDWEIAGTAVELETDLGGEFRFAGPGWYLTDTDTTLVFPEGETPNPWRHKGYWAPEQVWRFMVWNGQNPFEGFNAIVNAPTRLDERGDPEPAEPVTQPKPSSGRPLAKRRTTCGQLNTNPGAKIGPTGIPMCIREPHGNQGHRDREGNEWDSYTGVQSEEAPKGA